MPTYTYEQRSGLVIRRTAAENLSGHKVVALNNSGQAEYADKNNDDQISAIAGITVSSTTSGNSTTIQTYGPMTELSWSWTPRQPIYCGTNGALTQVVPTSGWLRQVALAETATKIFIDIQEPIQLV